MQEQRERERERERLTKGCYALSSLTLARLSCARKYKANYKPITQMDISSSDAPWVVQTKGHLAL